MEIHDASEMMLDLAKATANYIYRRIEYISYREAYAKGMAKCIETMKNTAHSHSLMRTLVGSIERDLDKDYPQTFFKKFRIEREYYMLAVENSLDIINSIEGRFITGTSDSDPRFYKDKDLFIYRDQLEF